MLKRTYLYRIYRHSKPAFLLVVVFIACYAMTLSKKMDMIFFPYNAMFADRQPMAENPVTYRLLVNDVAIRFTHFPYWKKDFIETSLSVYAHYLAAGRRLYLEDFLSKKFYGKWLIGRITPNSASDEDFPRWLAGFAGRPLRDGDGVAVISLRLSGADISRPVFDTVTIYRK